MHHLIMFILSAEESVRTKSELKVTKYDCHGLYYDGKLLKCARMAGALGMLDWETEENR